MSSKSSFARDLTSVLLSFLDIIMDKVVRCVEYIFMGVNKENYKFRRRFEGYVLFYEREIDMERYLQKPPFFRGSHQRSY